MNNAIDKPEKGRTLELRVSTGAPATAKPERGLPFFSEFREFDMILTEYLCSHWWERKEDSDVD
jgi:hypothetical protein